MQLDFFNLSQALSALAKLRPVFHSEADFQHALAWELHERFRNFDIRLERCLRIGASRLRVDLWIADGETVNAIELKYRTRRCSITSRNETFDLQKHAAQPIGRYQFIADIARLETIIQAKLATRGFSLFLTNESSYWTSNPRTGGIDNQFQLSEGRELKDCLRWSGSVGNTAEGRRHGSPPLLWR